MKSNDNNACCEGGRGEGMMDGPRRLITFLFLMTINQIRAEFGQLCLVLFMTRSAILSLSPRSHPISSSVLNVRPWPSLADHFCDIPLSPGLLPPSH